MLKLTPVLLALAYGLAFYVYSSWRMLRHLDDHSAELADPGLASVFARLAAALGLPRIRVFLYEIDPVNGLAAPDGRVFITRGMYRRYREGALSAEELASVVAHELGHVALKHTRRRMIDFTAQNAVRMAGGLLLGRLVPGLGFRVSELLARLLAARLSRADEFEADAYAAALMTRAGLGTAPQKALFAKLDRLAGGNMAAAPAWLLSHPKPALRIAAIERLEARWGTGQG